jgi:hypothetical protein
MLPQRQKSSTKKHFVLRNRNNGICGRASFPFAALPSDQVQLALVELCLQSPKVEMSFLFAQPLAVRLSMSGNCMIRVNKGFCLVYGCN